MINEECRSHAEDQVGPWTARPVLKLLSNPIYMGRIRHRDGTLPGTHCPIVSPELFERAALKAKVGDRGLPVDRWKPPTRGRHSAAWHQLDERAQRAALADVVATVLYDPRDGRVAVTLIEDAGDQLRPQLRDYRTSRMLLSVQRPHRYPPAPYE